MLFNSYGFIFLFLPIALLGFFFISRRSYFFAAGWLVVSSVFFYGFWNPKYVLLLVGSILGNYAFGKSITRDVSQRCLTRAKWKLLSALGANLLLLGYFKYASFFLSAIDEIGGLHLSLEARLLPLGISFFTFTQIAFLVDTYQGKVAEQRLIHYALFVTYFPHLIAGPVLHHREMMPQFEQRNTYRFSFDNVAVGMTIFVLGLFKKVVLADSIAPYANHVFHAAHSGVNVTFIEAWFGALAYSLQLYFDFSGYSDMAVGLSRLFGVTLPINFNSPYKARSVIEFWRRWHMTLSRFLRDYLYIPLGGSRAGNARRFANLMVTMILGGLWHGAGWTFVLWGTLHGIYLLVNHAWRAFRISLPIVTKVHSSLRDLISWGTTFIAVIFSWVIFRADDLNSAKSLILSMMGRHGVVLPQSMLAKLGESTLSHLSQIGVSAGNLGLIGGKKELLLLVVLLMVVLYFPNVYQVMRNYQPTLTFRAEADAPARILWRPTWLWVFFTVVISVTSLLLMRPSSDFLYFQF